jgi:hypothetical protein
VAAELIQEEHLLVLAVQVAAVPAVAKCKVEMMVQQIPVAALAVQVVLQVLVNHTIQVQVVQVS